MQDISFRYVDRGLFWTEEQFVELHFEVMSSINLNTEVPRTFRQLNVIHVKRAKKSHAVSTPIDNIGVSSAQSDMPQV